MSDPNFSQLKSTLIRGGVAPKRVRRIAAELQVHFVDLKEEAMAAGCGADQATRLAIEKLGDQALIAEETLARPELKSWTWRWPWLVFGVAPVVIPVLSIALICVLGFAVFEAFNLYQFIDLYPAPGWLTLPIELLRLFMMYIMPVAFALAWLLHAQLRSASAVWTFVAVALALIVGCGFIVTLNWATAAGEVASLGISLGFSTKLQSEYFIRLALATLLIGAAFISCRHIFASRERT